MMSNKIQPIINPLSKKKNPPPPLLKNIKAD